MFSFLPMPEEYGMDLAPNTASSIAVQLNKVLGPEYFSPSVLLIWILPDPSTAWSIYQSLRWFLGRHCNPSSWKHKLLTGGRTHLEIFFHRYSLLIIVLSLSCANECVTRRQLQRLAIATGPVSHFPPLESFPPAFQHTTSIVLNRLFSVTFSLHRTPCSIKLVDNPERDCYADVVALFDNEIMLFQPKIFSKGIILLLQEMSLWDGMWWATVPEQGQLIRINPNKS